MQAKEGPSKPRGDNSHTLEARKPSTMTAAVAGHAIAGVDKEVDRRVERQVTRALGIEERTVERTHLVFGRKVRVVHEDSIELAMCIAIGSYFGVGTRVALEYLSNWLITASGGCKSCTCVHWLEGSVHLTSLTSLSLSLSLSLSPSLSLPPLHPRNALFASLPSPILSHHLW